MGLAVLLAVILGGLLLFAAAVDHRDKKRGQRRRSNAQVSEIAGEERRDARAMDRRLVQIQDDVSWTSNSRRAPGHDK